MSQLNVDFEKLSTNDHKSIWVTASSSGFNGSNHARITVNDVDLVLPFNITGNHRGFHIAIINNKTGTLQGRVFDTYDSAAEFEKFLSDESNCPEGHFVVAACKDDCAQRLSKKCKQWFKDMGSQEIDNVEYREGFAFIGVLGRNQALEKRAKDEGDTVSVT